MTSHSYDPSAFNSLPLLSTAGRMFDAKNGNDLIANKFRKLFCQYKVDRVFGLSLLHRHFDLESDERLVEYRGTSIPWADSAQPQSAHVQPTNWVLAQDGNLRPYEFHYAVEGEDDYKLSDPGNPAYSEFIGSFEKLLHEEDAVGLFGLCKYPGDDFPGRVEITEGRANINFLPDDVPKGMNGREAAWFFSPTLYAKCACICYLEGGDGDHTGRHGGHVRTR